MKRLVYGTALFLVFAIAPALLAQSILEKIMEDDKGEFYAGKLRVHRREVR